MGFKKNWDVDTIKSIISKCVAEMNSPYNDGFTQWGCKQDLYEIYFYLNSVLEKTPNFSHMEEDYLKSKAHENLIIKLKDNYALR